MLHRGSRETVNTADHLTTFKGETSCSGWDLGPRRNLGEGDIEGR